MRSFCLVIFAHVGMSHSLLAHALLCLVIFTRFVRGTHFLCGNTSWCLRCGRAFLFGGELGGAGGALLGVAAAWGVGECDGEFLEGLRRVILFEE